MGQIWSESFPPKSKFSEDDVPDLSGKVMLVTGGNTGIGKETIRTLLKKNAKVYMASRNKGAADIAIAELKKDTGKEAIFLELDLAELKSVKLAAEMFLRQETQLNVLFNNGGVGMPPIDLLTSDGYDLQFGTNVLGHFYFTKLLLPILLETSKISPEGHVRVITTSSSGHLFCKGIEYVTLRDNTARTNVGTAQLYFQSKFGNIVFAKELGRRYGDQGIVSLSCNPGNIKTGIQRHIIAPIRWIMYLFIFDAPYGAQTQLWAGVSPEARELNGKYLIPWARLGSARHETQNPFVGEELWDWLEEQVKDV